MLAPLSWLKEYVDIDITPEELAQKLFSIGFEIEGIDYIGKDISNIVVGEVKSLEHVPGTHIHVCQVDCGSHGVFQICCGANNVAAGKKYPVALNGASVLTHDKSTGQSKPMAIKPTKIQGHESNGMLCSGAELGLSENLYKGAGYDGLLELSDSEIVGADIKPIVGLDEVVFDISVTANRPDCQSIYGIAKEVAAVLQQPIKQPNMSYKITDKKIDFEVKVHDFDVAPRYNSHYVYDVKIESSPQWMKRRLELVGINPLNNIVDITNYILKELGQPMHAFDFANLEGNQINVKLASDGQKFVALNDEEYTLSSNDLLIYDVKKPVAIAGVIGGQNSQITNDTNSIMFESAKFARNNIRKTSRRLGLASDSSAMFEKGVSEISSIDAMKRALHLVEQLGAGKISSTGISVSQNDVALQATPLIVSIKKINNLLGIVVENNDILRILTNLDFEPKIDGDNLSIMIPPYRSDIEYYADIAEEIIRFYGYENIKPTFLTTSRVTMGGRNKQQLFLQNLRRVLYSLGFYETIHYSFYSPKDFDLIKLPKDDNLRNAIAIINPLKEDLSLMRTILTPSMINAIERNIRRNNHEGKLYEIANVYFNDGKDGQVVPREEQRLSFGWFGNNQTYITAKGMLESIATELRIKFDFEKSTQPFLHPGITASVSLYGENIGFIGQLSHELKEELSIDKPVILAEIDLQKIINYAFKKFQYEPISKYNVVSRDIALIVDEKITNAQIIEQIQLSDENIIEIEMFDIYRGEQVGKDKKSMAYRLTLANKEKDLSDEEVNSIMQKVLTNLNNSLSAYIRQ